MEDNTEAWIIVDSLLSKALKIDDNFFNRNNFFSIGEKMKIIEMKIKQF